MSKSTWMMGGLAAVLMAATSAACMVDAESEPASDEVIIANDASGAEGDASAEDVTATTMDEAEEQLQSQYPGSEVGWSSEAGAAAPCDDACVPCQAGGGVCAGASYSGACAGPACVPVCGSQPYTCTVGVTGDHSMPYYYDPFSGLSVGAVWTCDAYPLLSNKVRCTARII